MDEFGSLRTLYPPLQRSLLRFETNCSPSGSPQCTRSMEPARSEASLQRDSLSGCIYRACILRWPLFSLGVCVIAGACWSPSGCLDLVVSIHAKNNTPSSCKPGYSAGTYSLLHSHLALHPDQLWDMVKKEIDLQPLQIDHFWMG